MSEYISERCADRFTESIERNRFEVLIRRRRFKALRCYDCKWYDVPEREYCRLWNRHFSGYDYCSYADPK